MISTIWHWAFVGVVVGRMLVLCFLANQYWGWHYLFAIPFAYFVAPIALIGPLLSVFAANVMWDWYVLGPFLFAFLPPSPRTNVGRMALNNNIGRLRVWRWKAQEMVKKHQEGDVVGANVALRDAANAIFSVFLVPLLSLILVGVLYWIG